MTNALVFVPPVSAVIPGRKPGTGARRRTLAGETMGTTWQVQWFDECDEPAERLLGAVERELGIVIAQMSHWLPDSQLSRLQTVPAGVWTPLGAEFCQVLQCALRVAQETDGAYDPTLGGLVAQWGFGPPSPPLASNQGWRKVELDIARSRLRHAGDLTLDLSAIAKGFAVDQLARLLHRVGLDHFLVEIGGELCAAGLKPDLRPWWVELEPPGDVPFPNLRVALSGYSVATSGSYRQVRVQGDQSWSHTIDPRTGHPVAHSVISVTVLHKECMEADAYSTALLVLGLHAGLDFADTHNLAALMVAREADSLVIHVSRAWREMSC